MNVPQCHVVGTLLVLLSWRTCTRNIRREEVIVALVRSGHARLTQGRLLPGELALVCQHCGAPLSVSQFQVEWRFHIYRAVRPKHMGCCPLNNFFFLF
jgi:hypothetical protein